MTISRTYNSNSKTAKGVGVGWTINYNSSIQVVRDTGLGAAQNSVASLKRPDGKQYSFKQSGVGSPWVAELDVAGTLVDLLDTSGLQTGWRYKNERDEFEIYNALGQLTGIVDAVGVSQTLAYDTAGLLRSVVDMVGRRLDFQYDTYRRVTSIKTPVGIYVYAYSGSAQASNMSTVTYPDSSVRTYLYGEPSNVSSTPSAGVSYASALTGIVDEKGIRYATFKYDSEGRAISTEHAGGVEKVSVTYNTDGTATVVDALNTSRDYGFATTSNSARNTGITNQPCDGCYTALVYDANGNVSSQDDFTGNRICSAYDLSRNLNTVKVEGLATTDTCNTVLVANATLPTGARKTSRQWHPNLRLLSKTAEPGRITTYVYNGQPDPFNANAVATCAPGTALLPDGTPIAVLCKQVEQASMDADGHLGMSATLVASVPNRVRMWTYNSRGQVLTSKGARTDVGDTSTWVYFDDTSPSAETVADSKAVLLVHGAGANASTSVNDSSLSHAPLTANGNATISTVQNKFGGSSLFFDGFNGSVTTPFSSDFAFGNDDFTIESWVYQSSNTTGYASYYQNIIGVHQFGNGVNASFALATAGGRFQAVIWATGGVAIITANDPLPLSAWAHVALVRIGATLTAYVNGTNVGSTPIAGTNYISAGAVSIGSDSIGAGVWNGYIDEVRVTKGVARYTGNFTPSMQAFADPSSRENLGHMPGDIQSITNAASHTTQFTLYDTAGRVRQMTDAKGIQTDMTYTPRGWIASVVVTPPGGPARTTSYTYDPVGQLTRVSNADGTTMTYTYDAAHRLTSVSDSKGNTVAYTLDAMGNRTNERVLDASNYLRRNITRVYDALNRLQKVSHSDLLLPPTNPADAADAKVVLLVHGNGANGSTVLSDSSPSHAPLAATGVAAISTTQSKFGGSSLLFDGANGSVTTPFTSDFSFGTDDFTVEAWVYQVSNNTGYAGQYQNVVGVHQFGNAVNASFAIATEAGRVQTAVWTNAGTAVITAASPLQLNAWAHVAIVRTNAAFNLYVNGLNVGTAAISGSNNFSSGVVAIGSDSIGAGVWNGYIDEVRVTKGVARYIGNFTPPTQAFADPVSNQQQMTGVTQ